jgi:hypothetical protein
MSDERRREGPAQDAGGAEMRLPDEHVLIVPVDERVRQHGPEDDRGHDRNRAGINRGGEAIRGNVTRRVR